MQVVFLNLLSAVRCIHFSPGPVRLAERGHSAVAGTALERLGRVL